MTQPLPHLRRKPFWASHPSYSRPNLGPGIYYGEEYDRRCIEMQIGSALLLDAILAARAVQPCS